jgi:endonuclease YncB( thermonuclease family)
MAGYSHPYERARSSRRPSQKRLFLFVVSLVFLTGFYACSRPHLGRSHVEPRMPVGGPITGRPWVVDGDTVRIAGTSIRLEGIDAPEWNQSCTDAGGKSWLCGQTATRQLRERIRGQSLTCMPRAIDRYGRVVATCSLPGGDDVNAWLVRQGWAVASGFSGIYASEEAEAKAEKRGIWAGTFIAPREWRRQKDPRHFFGGWGR